VSIRDLTFSLQGLIGLLSLRKWCCVFLQKFIDVSENHTGTNFRVKT